MSEARTFQFRGNVQGVGFRPFVVRLANKLQVNGYVRNSSFGASIHVEGPSDRIEAFRQSLVAEGTGPWADAEVQEEPAALQSLCAFTITQSVRTEHESPVVLPLDSAPCGQCLVEMRDPDNRRYRHAFISCTDCGPRFSLQQAVPFDRQRTTMADFPLCELCRQEYVDPSNRRFHAQTNCCPDCGPRLVLSRGSGDEAEDPLRAATQVLQQGGVLLLKGVGGFQLLCRADDQQAVQRIRQMKKRPDKALAVMCADLDGVSLDAMVDRVEAEALVSPARPIVVLARTNERLAHLAPDSRTLGVMLPASPFQQMLVEGGGVPLVATSANLDAEPISMSLDEVPAILCQAVDAVLSHNRDIAHMLDDSVGQVIDGEFRLFRAARGYAPYVLPGETEKAELLAMGADEKACFAVCNAGRIVVGQHIGELKSAKTYERYLNEVRSLQTLLQIKPQSACHDYNPDFSSSRFAASFAERHVVEHHVAHAFAAIAESRVERPILSVCWDGFGLGPQGAIRGGEFYLVDGGEAQHVAALRPFPLPLVARAVREPELCALGVLTEIGMEKVFELDRMTIKLASAELQQKRSRQTSSIGRLFDAVAALLGLCRRVTYEAQAAIRLQACAERASGQELSYEVCMEKVSTGLQLDWRPMIKALLQDLHHGQCSESIALAFHRWLSVGVVQVASELNCAHVALGGGVFQNKLLCERIASDLREHGREAILARRVPLGDGGIAVGQALAVCRGRR